MKLIKEKFLSKFKNKERAASLRKILKLFEKYQNFRNNNLNHSFSNLKVIPFIPFKHLKTQSKNRLSTTDIKNTNNNKKKKIFNHKYSFNLEKDYINKTKTINNIINNERKMNTYNIKNDINNRKLKTKKKINSYKGLKRKLHNLKNDDNKQNGFYKSKVIRDEKNCIGDDGKEKIIEIKQSTIDSNDKNGKTKLIYKEKDKYKIKNIGLLKNKNKKLIEFIKEKLFNKKSNNSITLQNKNPIKNLNMDMDMNNNPDIKINKNNKNINNKIDNNNIKNINTVNKINSNTKMNQKKNNKKIEEQYSTRNKLYEDNNNNILYKTVNNDNKKTLHLVKIEKLINEKAFKYRPLIKTFNINIYQSNIKPKIKDKIRILKCEKFDNIQNKPIEKQLFCNSNNFVNSSNPKGFIKNYQNSKKSNYSFKEITHLSNGNMSDYLNKDLESYSFRKKNNNKLLIIDSSNYLYNNQNKNNHIFYESYSLSEHIMINDNANKKDKFNKIRRKSYVQEETKNKNKICLGNYAFNKYLYFHKNKMNKNENNISDNNNIINISNSCNTNN